MSTNKRSLINIWKKNTFTIRSSKTHQFKATDQDLINFMNKHYKPETAITVLIDFDKLKCLNIIKQKTKMLPKTPLIHQLKSRS